MNFEWCTYIKSLKAKLKNNLTFDENQKKSIKLALINFLNT